MELCYDSSCHGPAGWRCLSCGENVCQLHLLPEDHDCADRRSHVDDLEPPDECDLGEGD